MRLPEALSAARELVPGDGEPQVTALGSGLNNDTFRVDRDGRVFSMRLARAMSPDSKRDRAFEIEIVRRAAARGLAPALVHADAERGFLVQEWVEGRAWPAAAALDASGIVRVAQLLRQVHGLPLPADLRVGSPRSWIALYTQALQARRLGIGAGLADAARARIEVLEALPAETGVACHSDLHLMNLIESGRRGEGALVLLDWEYTHVTEAFWDLAGWGANNDYRHDEMRALLCAYLEREPQESEWGRCKLLVWLYDYVCLLWSELYVSSHGGAIAAGIAERAGVLHARLGAS